MKVAGIEIEKVNEGVLNAALQAAELPTTGALGTRVRRYAQHVKETVPAAAVADCTTCGGASSVQAQCCPYCGDGELEGEAVDVATTPAPPAAPQPEPPAEVDPTPEEPPPAPPPVSRRLKSAPKQTTLPPEPTAAPEPAAEPPQAQPPQDPPKDAPSAQLATPSAMALEQEAQLDRAVQRVQQCKEMAAVSIWELGQALHSIHQSGLWQARTKPDGTRRYLAWGDFTEHELGISQGYAHKLMHVSVEYTREQVERLGAGKLYIALQVPRESRALLLEAAEQGATRQKLGEIANEIGRQPIDNDATGETPDEDDATGETPDDAPDSTPARRGGSRDGAGRPVSKVTVSALLKRVEIPLVTGTGKKARPARSLDDNPRAVERMVNGVLQEYFITKNPDGTLVLVVDRKREQR